MYTPSPERITISDKYFEQYNLNGEPYNASRQWSSPDLDYGSRFVIREWYNTHRLHGYSKEQMALQRVLDLGAANGALMSRLRKQHPKLDLYGVESAEWAQRNVLPEWKDRIKFGDWLDVSSEYDDGQFDAVIDCVSQYIPRSNLSYALRETRRVARKGVVSVINTIENGDLDDPHRQITKKDDWWLKKLQKASREAVYMTDNGLFIWR